MANHASVWRRSGLDEDAVAASLDALCPSIPFDWPALWACCRRRIRRWPRPRRWSAADWWDEAHSQGVASACQALRDFDPSHGHPLHRFVRWRVLGGVWALYRREWSYSIHCAAENVLDQLDDPHGDLRAALDDQDALRAALALLSRAQLRLIECLFWDGETESAIAAAGGISQPAVSKQKRLALKHLRCALAASGELAEDSWL